MLSKTRLNGTSTVSFSSFLSKSFIGIFGVFLKVISETKLALNKIRSCIPGFSSQLFDLR